MLYELRKLKGRKNRTAPQKVYIVGRTRRSILSRNDKIASYGEDPQEFIKR